MDMHRATVHSSGIADILCVCTHIFSPRPNLHPRPTHTHAQMCAQTARGIRPRLPELTHIRIFKIAGFKLVVEAAYRIIWLGKPVEDHRSDDEEEAPAETPMTKKKGQ